MKIVIATGIYPPEIGGPAQYSKHLKEIWTRQGHEVSIEVFSRFNYLPAGIRHFFYFLSILPKVARSDYVIALDTFSCALPAVLASKVFSKKVVLRSGGDFLWEKYVERTGDLVTLSDFYNTRIEKLSLKEKIIFSLIRFVLSRVDSIVWSTEWQKNISINPYILSKQNHFVIENYYGPKESDVSETSKVFVASTRNLKLKNLLLLEKIFNRIKSDDCEVELFKDNLPFADFMNKIKTCYAIVQISLGDISPNMILDAIRYNRPFICTREVGIFDRIKDVGIFVDPLNEEEIQKAVLSLLNKEEYEKSKEKIRQFYFVHTWEDIAKEFLGVYESIK